DVDLDLAVITPDGARASWASARGLAGDKVRSVRVVDARSRGRESLALTAGGTGPFVIEVVRAGGGTAAVTGSLSMRALGAAQTIPFTLGSGAPRQTVGRVDVRLESELVPVDDVPFDARIPTAAPFDRGAAVSALNVAAAGVRRCGSNSGPVGTGRVQVTFTG